jgi:hypothetical protein
MTLLDIASVLAMALVMTLIILYTFEAFRSLQMWIGAFALSLAVMFMMLN